MSKITFEIDTTDPRQVAAAKELLDAQHDFAVGRMQNQESPWHDFAISRMQNRKSPWHDYAMSRMQNQESPWLHSVVNEAAKPEAAKPEAAKPEAAKPEAAQSAEVTIDDLRKLVIAAKPDQKPDILAKLEEYGASRLPELHADNFAAFRDFLIAL